MEPGSHEQVDSPLQGSHVNSFQGSLAPSPSAI